MYEASVGLKMKCGGIENASTCVFREDRTIQRMGSSAQARATATIRYRTTLVTMPRVLCLPI